MYLHKLFILFLHEDNKMKFEENNLAHTKRKKAIRVKVTFLLSGECSRIRNIFSRYETDCLV